MHIETGHSTCQSKPTHLKDLRCPFCLYQTKNKNNMIDHIVLHREERVVPIEVRRPKLSRYLQGIVFRCHKCTFTSGSTENLCLHMMRHDDVKPYKCRLCYFDCTRLADLEAHLSDKHQSKRVSPAIFTTLGLFKNADILACYAGGCNNFSHVVSVLRNHELVGQVSLDQLEAWTGTRPEKNNDHKSDNEKMEAEEFNADCDDVPQTDKVSEYHSTENMMLPIKEEQGTQEQEEHETIPANSSVADFTQDRTQQNTTVLKRHQQGSQTQEQNVALHHSSKKLLEMNTEPNADECNNADIKNDDCSFAEKEGQTSKNQTTLTDGQKEVTERSSTSFKMADVQTDRLHYKEGHHKAQSIEAMVDDDIVRHVQLLDEDGSMSKSRRRSDPERNVKIGQNTEAIGEDKEKSDKSLSNDVCGTFFAQNLKFQDDVIANPATAKMNSAQGNNSTFREGFRFEPHMLTLLPNCTRLKLGHRESLGRFLANCKREQKQNAKIPKDESEPNREKGVLECVEEQRPHLEPCEEKEEADLLELKLDGEVDITMKDEDECKVQDTPHAPDGKIINLMFCNLPVQQVPF
ncbi:hypothetical protein GOODEAATRI_016141 [Goodea atripinnis]|uniref:C2H2-type domain-containing protein n=1 Tax=Goodea atripinnis TaxID=208336 RepID=A0ABV0NKQ0_9TELE